MGISEKWCTLNPLFFVGPKRLYSIAIRSSSAAVREAHLYKPYTELTSNKIKDKT